MEGEQGNSWSRRLLPFASFLALAVVWAMVCRLGDWSEEVVPSPGRVASGLWQMATDGTLLEHAVASLFRVTAGFYLAVLLGIPIGMILGWWKVGQLAFNSLLQFLRPISPLAWIPLAMLWFGIGEKPAVFLIFLASFFPLVVSAMAAVNDLDKTYFRVAANFGFSNREIVTKVLFPAILPRILPALRISLGIAWLVVVAAEMIAVKSGLGYLILDSRNALRMDLVLAAMIAIGAIGVLIDQVMVRLQSIRSLDWGRRG